MFVRQKSERFISIAIGILLVLSLAQGSWVGYRLWIEPRIQASADFPLPSEVRNLRGEPLPSLAALTPVKNYSLDAELQAPTTIVAFLLSNCPACQRAQPTLAALKKAHPETLGMVGIFAEPVEAIAAYETGYPRFVDPDRTVFDVFRAVHTPMFLVVRDGQVIYQAVGWSEEIGKQLESYASVL